LYPIAHKHEALCTHCAPQSFLIQAGGVYDPSLSLGVSVSQSDDPHASDMLRLWGLALAAREKRANVAVASELQLRSAAERQRQTARCMFCLERATEPFVHFVVCIMRNGFMHNGVTFMRNGCAITQKYDQFYICASALLYLQVAQHVVGFVLPHLACPVQARQTLRAQVKFLCL
jgi:hypothetical protein